MDIRKLQKDIHLNACDHGWWETERPVPEILCLIHSEVSEAFEAFENKDDENFAEEIADIAIRLADSAEGYNIDLIDTIRLDLSESVTESLCNINLAVSKALEAFRNHDKDDFEAKFKYIFSVLAGVALEYKIDLESEILKKHEINKTRSYKHGGKKC